MPSPMPWWTYVGIALYLLLASKNPLVPLIAVPLLYLLFEGKRSTSLITSTLVAGVLLIGVAKISWLVEVGLVMAAVSFVLLGQRVGGTTFTLGLLGTSASLFLVSALHLHLLSSSLLLIKIGLLLQIIEPALLIVGATAMLCVASKLKTTAAWDRRHLAALIVIIVLFTIIKTPLFLLPFGGDHVTKYNSYVEPAKYMAEQKDPTHFQKRYVANPINNPEGVFSYFWHLPLIEWGLALVFILGMPLVLGTHIFMHLIGIAALLACAIALRRFLTPRATLIALFFLSINSIFVFSTLTPAYDIVAIIFLMLTIASLQKGLIEKNRQERHRQLFITGVLLGIGTIAKYSVLIYGLPIVFLLVFLQPRLLNSNLTSIPQWWTRTRAQCKETLIIITPLLAISAAVVVSFRTSLNILPSAPVLACVGLLIWAPLWYGIYRAFMSGAIAQATQWSLRSSSRIIMCATLALIAGLVAFFLMDMHLLLAGFITDGSLLVRVDLYSHLLSRIRGYVTNNVFWIGLLGLIGAVHVSKKARPLVIALAAGSAIFLLLASKSIFFHEYYTLIIMITLIIGVGIASDGIMRTIGSPWGIAIAMIILLSLLPGSYFTMLHKSENQRQAPHFEEAMAYLDAQMGQGDFFIDEARFIPFVIYTGKKRTSYQALDVPPFEELVRSKGLAHAFLTYNITSIVTKAQTPRYDLMAEYYSDKPLYQGGNLRTSIILKGLGSDSSGDQQTLIEQHRIDEQFTLDAIIGPYRFFVPSTQASSSLGDDDKS